MNTQNIIIVAGFGRCGSSLVMQMMHAGGVPCIGTHPDYEDMRATSSSTILQVLTPGMAVKVLNPQHHLQHLDLTHARAIWLDRDTTEQAKSALKLMGLHGVTTTRSMRHSVRTLARSYTSDRARALQTLGPARTLAMRFEDLLTAPQHAAEQIARHIARPLDTLRAARQVIPRAPACSPSFEIEMRLLRQHAPLITNSHTKGTP